MTANNLVNLAFAIFFVKHFVVDFLLQPPWMFQNKHILGHPGGVVHAALHGLSTTIILLVFNYFGLIGSNFPTIYGMIAVGLGMIEVPVHYTIDYVKMNVGIYFDWKFANPNFWFALGFDQLLHYLTYCGILWYWFR